MMAGLFSSHTPMSLSTMTQLLISPYMVIKWDGLVVSAGDQACVYRKTAVGRALLPDPLSQSTKDHLRPSRSYLLPFMMI